MEPILFDYNGVLVYGDHAQINEFAEFIRIGELAREEAYLRALSMFERLLSPWQLIEFRGNGSVSVTGSEGSRFRIRCDRERLIYNILDITHQERWCFCLSGAYPLPDHWAAQLLTLVTDERRARAIANRQKSVGMDSTYGRI